MQRSSKANGSANFIRTFCITRTKRLFQIVRNYEQQFRHKVRLPQCRAWREGYIAAQLAHLERGKEWGQWFERKGDDFSVYGFRCPVHAGLLTDWSRRCGIDWMIPPELQTDRPSGPSEVPWKPEPPRAYDPNLHSLAGTERPLGVTCKACGHRALIPLDRLGAHKGNMQKIKSLKLKCSACESREWEPTIFGRAEAFDTWLQYSFKFRRPISASRASM
jgi:hypothetical protein